MYAGKNTSTDLGGKVLKRINLKIIINDKGVEILRQEGPGWTEEGINMLEVA